MTKLVSLLALGLLLPLQMPQPPGPVGPDPGVPVGPKPVFATAIAPIVMIGGGGPPGILTSDNGITYVVTIEKPVLEFHDCLGNVIGRYKPDVTEVGSSVVIDPGLDHNCGMVHNRKSNAAIDAQPNNQ